MSWMPSLLWGASYTACEISCHSTVTRALGSLHESLGIIVLCFVQQKTFPKTDPKTYPIAALYTLGSLCLVLQVCHIPKPLITDLSLVPPVDIALCSLFNQVLPSYSPL